MARVDFHVHTPASSDFLGPGSVEDVLQTCVARGLDAVVLTDHNTLDGYLELHGDGPDGLIVFPGVEVTCRGGRSGVHVLGVFDPARLGQRPRRLLQALGLDRDNRNAEGLSTLDVVGVCEAIHRRGGLAVAAHGASTKGLLTEIQGIQLGRILEACRFDAIELSTPGQQRRGLDVLRRLDVLDDVAIVSGTDSHRRDRSTGSDRPAGPGDRPTHLDGLETPVSFDSLVDAVRAMRGRMHPSGDRPPLERFAQGGDRSVHSLWSAQDRGRMAARVAALATAGGGILLAGIRRGGQGGRGVVVAREVPEAATVERWIWDDVRPVPAVSIRDKAHRGRHYIEIEIVAALNPFVYSADGRPVTLDNNKIITADLSGHAEQLLQRVRTSLDPSMPARLEEPTGSIPTSAIESLFPWRGYLSHEEAGRAIDHVAHWIAKGSESGVLRAWAFLEPELFHSSAIGAVRGITRSFAVAQARNGLRDQLDSIGSSRTLTRRVLSAVDGLLTSHVELEELLEGTPDTDVLERTCTRLAGAAHGELEAALRDAAVDETRRTHEALGALMNEEHVSVVLEATVGELDEAQRDALAAAFVEGPERIEVVTSSVAGDLGSRQIALVNSAGSEVVATGGPVVAVHAPVTTLRGLLRTHHEIARFNPAHVIPRDELMRLLVDRRTLAGLRSDDRLLIFNSCARIGLPVWWALEAEQDLSHLVPGLAAVIAETRTGTELGRLLYELALLPGDHSEIAYEAAGRSRAQRVAEMVELHREAWSRRVSRLVKPRRALSAIEPDEVTYRGSVVEADGEPVVEWLGGAGISTDGLPRSTVEACARALKYVVSENLFDVLVFGVRAGWQSATALQTVDEATFLPGTIREQVNRARPRRRRRRPHRGS